MQKRKQPRPGAPGPGGNDAPAGAAALLRIERERARLSPAQRRFNQLTAEIEAARATLARWEALAQQLHQRSVDEVLPAAQALRQAKQALVARIDELLSFPQKGLRLSQRRRRGLEGLLLRMLEDLLAEAPDPALEALHDRYSDLSHSEKQALDQQLQLETTEQIVEEMLGPEMLHEHGAASMEELLAHVEARLGEQAEQREQAREARRSQRAEQGRSSRADQAEARRAEETREARASVREIYRKLVSSLHPDRESDPTERARKTVLMQQISRAYQDNDLLTLLTLQMEVVQLDAEALAELPAQRLAHYNQVLREQLDTLQAEIQLRIHELHERFGEPGSLAVSRKPEHYEQQLRRQLRELREHTRQVLENARALADPRRRLAEMDAIADLVDELEAEELVGLDLPDDPDFDFEPGFDPDAVPDWLDLFGPDPAQPGSVPAPQRRKRKRKRGKR